MRRFILCISQRIFYDLQPKYSICSRIIIRQQAYGLSKIVSRILFYVIICLGQELLLGSGELLLTEVRDVFNPIFFFFLAPNKDLAVSLLHYCRIFPKLGIQNLSILYVTVRTSHITMGGC